MTDINILVGSTLGGTEYVAEAAQSLVEEAGHNTELHFNPDLDQLPITTNQVWLICVSTHGAGDYPDNFKPFIEQLTQVSQDLSHIRYGLVGIGDSNYDSFCYAAFNVDKLLHDKGATRLGELFTIDVVDYPMPEDRVVDWIPVWIEDLNSLID